jgi:hypothetical protein
MAGCVAFVHIVCVNPTHRRPGPLPINWRPAAISGESSRPGSCGDARAGNLDAHERCTQQGDDLVRAAIAITAAAAAALVIGADDERRRVSSPSPWQPPPACPVTIPNGSTPPGEGGSPDHHGNGRLWTALDRRGRFVVAPRSAPEYLGPHGEIAVDGVLLPDGSVGIKAPWWRGPGVRGRVRIQARRLDRRGRVDRTVPPSGYGLTGFQAMGLSLPTTGCWKVTGSVGKARLSFVTLVWRARPGR